MSTNAAPTGMVANAMAMHSFMTKSGTIVNNLRIALQSYQNADKSNDSAKLNAAVALLNGLVDQFNAAFPTTGGRERRVNGGAESDVYGAAEGCMCNAIYGSSAIGDIDDLRSKKGGDDMDIINSAHMNAIIDTFEKVGVKFRNKQSIQAITADIESVLPCNGKHPFNNNLAAQPAIVRTIATAVNTFVRAHSKVDFDIVNTGDSATPETMLSELCDWVGTFNVGMFAQRSIVERIVTRLVEDMNSAFALMEHAYNKLARIDCKKKDEIALLRAYYESARDSYKKSSQIFQNYLNIKPQEFKTQEGIKSIEGELFRNGRISVKISTEKFGDAISYLLNLMKSNVELAAELNEQLTKLGVTLSVSEIEGMSMSQYNDSVIDKLPQLTRNSSAEEIKNFELSRKNLLALYTAIKNNAAAANFPSAQRNMVKGRGEYDDTVSGGYGITGSVKTYTALEEERATSGLLIIREYGEAIQSKFKKFYESVIITIASLTKENQAIDFTELNGILTNLAELLKNGKGNLDKELLNVAGAKIEHQSKKQYISAINLLINVFKRFAQQYPAVDFKPVIDSLLSIEPTIEHFAARLTTKNISFEGSQLDSYLMTNNEILTDAINHLKYKVYLHNMGLSLLKVSKTYASYSEKYTETMGRAIASCIKQSKDTLTSYYEKVKNEDIIKTEIAKSEKIINNFYRAIQAVDLYILKTNRQITQNPHLQVDVFKLLSDAKMIAEWYSDDIGDKLIKLAENNVDFDVSALFKTIQDGTKHGAYDAALPVTVGADTKESITKLKDMGMEIYDKFQALKNIISIFSRITVLDSNTDIFMNPAQIYSAFVEFIKHVTFIYHTDKSATAPGDKKIEFRLMNCNDSLYKNELDLFTSAIGAMSASITTALNLYELQNSQSVMPCDLMKTRLILGGGLSDDFKIIPAAVCYYFRLLRLAEFYKMAFYDYQNVGELKLAKIDTSSDDNYLKDINAIKTHIETSLNTDIEIKDYAHIEWAANSINIMEEYLSDYKKGKIGNYRISMSPELDGIFGELNSFIAFNNTENGDYTDSEITKLVIIINKIYNHYTSKPDGSIEMAVNDYIEQVNRKFSLFSIEEYSGVKTMNTKLQMDMANDYAGSINNNYSILQGEGSLVSNEQLNIFAPSDNYKSGSSTTSDTSNYNLSSVKSAITAFNSRFSKLLANCNNTTTYAGLLLYTENELKKSSTDEVKLEILRSIIKNVGVNNDNSIDSYMYHETVRTGLTVLDSVNKAFTTDGIVYNYENPIDLGKYASSNDVLHALFSSKIMEFTDGTELNTDTNVHNLTYDNTKISSEFSEIAIPYKFPESATTGINELINAGKTAIANTDKFTGAEIQTLYYLMNLDVWTTYVNGLIAVLNSNPCAKFDTAVTAAGIQNLVRALAPNDGSGLLQPNHNKSDALIDEIVAIHTALVADTRIPLGEKTKHLIARVLRTTEFISMSDLKVTDASNTAGAGAGAAAGLTNLFTAVVVSAAKNTNCYFVCGYLYTKIPSLLSLMTDDGWFKDDPIATVTLTETNNYLVKLTNAFKSTVHTIAAGIKYEAANFVLDKLKQSIPWNIILYGLLFRGAYNRVPCKDRLNIWKCQYEYTAIHDNQEVMGATATNWVGTNIDSIAASIKIEANKNDCISHTYIQCMINGTVVLDDIKNIIVDNCNELDKINTYSKIINIDHLCRRFSSKVQEKLSSFLKSSYNNVDKNIEISVDISKYQKVLVESINYVMPIFSPFVNNETIKNDYEIIKNYAGKVKDKFLFNFNIGTTKHNLFGNIVGYTTAPFRPLGPTDDVPAVPLIMENKPFKLINQMNYAITEYLSIISDNTINDATVQPKGLYGPALTYLRNEVLRSFDFDFNMIGKNDHNYISDKRFIDSRYNILISQYLTVKTGSPQFTTSLISELSTSNKSLIKGKLPKLINDLKKYKKLIALYKTVFNNAEINANPCTTQLNAELKALHCSGADDLYICPASHTNNDILTTVKTLIDYGESFILTKNTPAGAGGQLLIEHNKIVHDYHATRVLDFIDLKGGKIISTDAFFSNADTFCTNFISVIEKLLKEFADTSPVYMETSENMLDYHIMNKNSTPIMPISAALLNSTDNKFLYATRYVNHSDGKIKPSHLPSIYKTLASFSAVHGSINILSEVELTNYINNIFSIIRILKDINVTFDHKLLAYSKEAKFTAIEDKVFNNNNILEFVSEFMTNKKSENKRINELISSFIELNVMPININSLMQSVPLINIMNYSSGFNDMVANNNKFTQIQKDLIINTFKPAKFTNSSYRISCYNWLVNDRTRPKFIYDQIYTKALMQPESTPVLSNMSGDKKLTPTYCRKVAELLFTLLHSKTSIPVEVVNSIVDHDISSINKAALDNFISNDLTNLDFGHNAMLRYSTAAAGAGTDITAYKANIINHLRIISYIDSLLTSKTPDRSGTDAQTISNAILYLSAYTDKHIQYKISYAHTAAAHGAAAINHYGFEKISYKINKLDTTKVANDRYNSILIRNLLFISEIQRFINAELNEKLSIGKTSIINSLSLLGSNVVNKSRINNNVIFNDVP